MASALLSILGFAAKSLKTLAEFLLFLVLGLLAGILYALPWLLRGVTVLAWFAAGFVAITAIQQFYTPIVSSPIPIYALQFAAIFLMLIWPITGMLKGGKNRIWGMLAACSILVGSFFWKAVPWLLSTWPEYTELGLRLLPSALFMVLLVSTTLRMKTLRTTATLHLPGQSSGWLINHIWKGGDD
jgi:hypothetical protein